jgi:hypothetical protein
MKTTKTLRFFNKRRTSVGLVSNLNHETRKNNNKKMTSANKNPTKSYCKKEIE